MIASNPKRLLNYWSLEKNSWSRAERLQIPLNERMQTHCCFHTPAKWCNHIRNICTCSKIEYLVLNTTKSGTIPGLPYFCWLLLTSKVPRTWNAPSSHWQDATSFDLHTASCKIAVSSGRVSRKRFTMLGTREWQRSLESVTWKGKSFVFISSWNCTSSFTGARN